MGFFVLFAASKIEGWLSLLGKLIGAWLYLLAVLAIACAIVMPLTGGHVFGAVMPGHMGPGWMFRWQHACPPPAGPAAMPAPATPAKPAPPAKAG